MTIFKFFSNCLRSPYTDLITLNTSGKEVRISKERTELGHTTPLQGIYQASVSYCSGSKICQERNALNKGTFKGTSGRLDKASISLLIRVMSTMQTRIAMLIRVMSTMQARIAMIIE